MREPLALAASLGLALAACRAPAPRPLAPEVHRAAWLARGPRDVSLASFLSELGWSDPGRDLFDPSDGLALEEAELVALWFHPDLRIARLELARAGALRAASGRRLDGELAPELALSMLRSTAGGSDPWFLEAGLGFTLPLAGRLDAERAQAAADERAALEAVREAEWERLLELRRAWADWSALRLEGELHRDLFARTEPLAAAARRLSALGELPSLEVGLIELWRARLEARVTPLAVEAEAGELRLLELMGLAPASRSASTPPAVVLVPRLDAPSPPGGLPAGTPRTDHPALARLAAEYEASEEALRLEYARRWPDLTLGPGFVDEPSETRVGLFGAVRLPPAGSNARGLARARADRELARARYDRAHEALEGRLARSAARARALALHRDELERAAVPLLERQLDEAARLAALGELPPLALLETLSRALDLRLELLADRRELARVRAELRHAIGPDADETARTRAALLALAGDPPKPTTPSREDAP